MSMTTRHSNGFPIQTWSRYLLNLADANRLSSSNGGNNPVVTTTANCPSREYYTPDNLVVHSTTNCTTSWMADTFVRPPVMLTFTFR